jgi:cell division protein FtsB
MTNKTNDQSPELVRQRTILHWQRRVDALNAEILELSAERAQLINQINSLNEPTPSAVSSAKADQPTRAKPEAGEKTK